jgi:hypothetical protein
MADLDQPRRHRGSHPAEAGYSDLHGRLLTVAPLFHPVNEFVRRTPAHSLSFVLTIGENGD